MRSIKPPNWIGLALALFTLALARQVRASPLDPRGEDWEGLSQLVRMAESELGARRVVVTSTLDLRGIGRADSLFIVHPERTLDADELAAFMHAGGRVLLLDDYGTGDGLLTRFGIRRVPLPGQPAEMLRGNPALAIAEAASAHPAVRDVARVVTNHATGLAQQGLSPLLVVHGDREPDVLLAVAGAVGQGRFLAVGDASIAMNAMLRYPGNRALSLALIRYAAEDDVWGTRGGKLYVLTNDFDTTGTFGDSSRAGSTLGETRRTLLEALETLRRDGMPPLAAYLVALAVALGVVAWTSTRAGKTHKPSTPRFVRPVPVVAQGGVAGHAATIGAPGTARLLAMLELKSALEEQLAARLDLARAPSHEELVARVRAAGLLDEANVGELSRTLASLMRIEATFMTRRGAHAARVRDADVVAMASRVRGLLDLVPPVGSAPRDRVGEHP